MTRWFVGVRGRGGGMVFGDWTQARDFRDFVRSAGQNAYLIQYRY